MTQPTAFERVADRLAEVTGYRPAADRGDWRCPGPGHAAGDRRPSLSVTRGDDRVLVHCQAGCELDDVLASLQLTPGDLFDAPHTNGTNGAGRRSISATYDYTDETGRLLFQAVRWSPKAFTQRRPDGNGGWVNNLSGTRRVLYRLPHILKAVESGAMIFVAEGEKDVESLERAGEVATCNPMGAGKWRPEFAETLTGAEKVVVVVDRDPAGRKHALAVARSLGGRVGELLIAEPLAGKDVSDHLAAGHTVNELDVIGIDGLELAVAADRPTEAAPTDLPTVTDSKPADEDPDRELLKVALSGAAKRAAVDGATWILDTPVGVAAVWGDGADVLASHGEPLLIVGPQGVGKTTIAQQFALARLGLRPDVIGYPVELDDRRVLYIAADRPLQAARSMRRMVSETDRPLLAERFEVWRGPLPFDLVKRPELLAAMAEHFNAGTIVIDSLKDVAGKLSEDEAGQKVNAALQMACMAGCEVVALHHQRKKQQGGAKPNTLDDVFGSTWITAGAGSVVLIWGAPGDALVTLDHLKQPAEPVGPLTLLHDHAKGVTAVENAVDLLAIVRTSNGLTAEGAARALFRTEHPKRNDVERARRKLDALVKAGHAQRQEGERGLDGRQQPARFYATETRR